MLYSPYESSIYVSICLPHSEISEFIFKWLHAWYFLGIMSGESDGNVIEKGDLGLRMSRVFAGSSCQGAHLFCVLLGTWITFINKYHCYFSGAKYRKIVG